ncbi:hypothetical protein [Brassicibacter mesophilus]|uniref:hypothetical protein n=1 Tax=Brassicibacter mesophilus TaxID=745119 RepID=UPI003D25D634
MNKNEVYIGNDYKWVKGKNLNWPTGIFDIRLEQQNIDEKLIQIVDGIKFGKLPKLVMTGPSTRPADIDLYLKKYGFIKKSEAIGMALYLDEINNSNFCNVSLK